MTDLFPDPHGPFPIRPNVKPKGYPPPDVTYNPDGGLGAALATVLMQAGPKGISSEDIFKALAKYPEWDVVDATTAMTRHDTATVIQRGGDLFWVHKLHEGKQ